MDNANTLRNTKNGLLQGVINIISNLLLPFVSRTVLIYVLGTEYLGLGGLFSSILQILSLSELGVGAAISYMLYKPVAENDITEVNKLLNFYRIIYRCIGVVILFFGIICIPFFPLLIKGEVPVNINLYVLYFVYLSQTVLSYFMFAYKTVLLNANQRYDIFVFIQTIIKFISSISQIFLLLIFKSYYAYVIVLPIMVIFNNILDNFFVHKLFPMYYPHGHITSASKKLFVKNVIGAFSTKIGETIYFSADQLIISAILGLQTLGIYTNYYYIITSIIAIFAIIHNTLRPVLGNHINTKSLEENFSEFRIINFGYMFFISWCSVCLLCIYQPFMELWVGKNNMFPNVVSILFSLYFYTWGLCSVQGIYRDSAGIWWQGKYISLIAGITNLVLNTILALKFGIKGILVSSIITSILVIFPGYTYIVFKYYFNSKGYAQKLIADDLIYSGIVFLVAIITSLLVNLANLRGFSGFVLKLIICVFSNTIFLLLFNLWNKRLWQFLTILKKMVRKSRK